MKQRVKILNVNVDFMSMEEALSWVEGQIKYNKRDQITTPNPEQVVLAQKDGEFRQALNGSGLAICDGIGLSWAAGNNQRLSGADLMLALCQLAAKKGWRVFLLGGKDGVAAAAAAKFQISNFKFQIKTNRGAEDIKKINDKENKEIIQEINQFHPQILFVAYGAPYQEKWIAKNLPQLKVNIAMGVGGGFDYLAGTVARAPKWVRFLGLEWLWRLILQPWRLKRQLALLKFIWLVISR